jgi:hypothetical protein
MIKAADKWFRLLKGIPLNEQKDNVEQLVQAFKIAYKKDAGVEYSDEKWLRQYAEKNPKGLAGEIERMGGAVGAEPTAVGKPDQKITCPEGAAFNPKTKKCERQMSMVRKATTKKIQQIAKQPARGKPAVKFAQIVVGDIIHGDAHLPEEKRKIKPDGFVGPITLKAFATVGIDSSFIGDEPEDRENWRMATKNIEVIRNALAEKYNAALPHIGTEKALVAAQAVKMTAKRIAKTVAPKRGKGKAEVTIAQYHGGINPSGVKAQEGGGTSGRPRVRKLGGITSIVVHDSLTSGLGGMMAAMTKPRTSKSGNKFFTGTHFSIDGGGKVLQHAPLNTTTNHSGAGNYNKRSVGIDILTTAGGVGAGEPGYKPPAAEQMESLYQLVNQLKSELPALSDTVLWPDPTPENNNGWFVMNKSINTADGITSHGHVQANRRDGLTSTYYVKLRKDGMSAAEAYKKALEDEQRARVEFMTSPDSQKYMTKMKKKAQRGNRKAKRIVQAAAALRGRVSESKKPDLKESIKVKISEKKTLTEEWWYERRDQDNIAYNKNLGKEFRKMKHVKSGAPFNCNPPSKMAAGIKPAKGSKC